MLTQNDLRGLLNEAGSSWPLDVIAQQSGVSEESITSYLRDGTGMNADDFERLNNWADRHSGMTGIGTLTFATYQRTRTIGACLAPSANDLPKGAKYEPGSINAGILDLGMDATKFGAWLDHNSGAQLGNDTRVKGSEVAARLLKAAS